MADSIVRLRVESQEYDAKLKRATEGLTRYADECRKVGGTLEVVEQETLEYVRSLGQMDTASRTATGKLNEMKKTFVELKTQYNQLTEAEKASPFGQALGQSLEQLKGRIKEGESALKGVQGEVNGTGGVLDQLASKFTLNVDAIKLFEMGMKAAGVVADVAKDAFFKNEEQLDEWGRVVEGAQSVYEGFLSALNTGDIGGYLSNINNIIQAARDAYDALDNLGTYNAFNQVNVERTRTNMTQAIADYRTGDGTREQAKAAGDAYKKELADRRKMEQDAYIAAIKETATQRGVNPDDLRKALSGNYGQYQALKNTPLTGTRTQYTPGLMPGQAGSYTQVKVAANEQERLGEALRQLNDTELKSLQALGAQAQRTGNEIAQVDRTLARMLGSGGRTSGGTASGGTSSTTKTPQGKAADIVSKAEAEYAATLDKIAVRREAGLDTALQAKQKEVSATEKLYDAYTSAYNTYADPTYKDMASFAASMLGALAGKVNEAKDAQDAEKQAAQQLAEAEKKKARDMEQQKLMGTFSESGISAGISYLKGKKAEAVVGSAEYKNFDTQLTDATTMSTLTGVMDKYNITPDQINVDAAGIWQKIINGNDIANADWESVTEAINEKLSELGIEPIKLDVQTGGLKNVAKDVDILASTTKNAGSAMTQLGGALAGLEDPSAKVAGIVMQAIGNVALSFSQAMATPKDPWSWIAFAVAGTATMISTIAAIHSATGYAEGGVIPGNSFSGDNQLARVNAGELILSKSAQANLANQLDNPALPGDGALRQSYVRGQDIFLGLNNYLRSSGRGQLVTSRG